MKPLITVLTTVYNGLPYLTETIESVLNQTYENFEFLIIDDASTDGSIECIKSYNDPRIKFVQNEHNMGQVPSLNKGLALAKGDYIARLDHDDVCLSSRLEEQVNYMLANPSITLVCSWEYSIDSNGNKTRSWTRTIQNYGEYLSYIILGLCPVWHPSVMFVRDTIKNIGGFNTAYAPAEDYHLWSMLALNRFNAAIVPQYHLLQRVHEKRQSVLQSGKQQASTIKTHLEVISKFTNSGAVKCLAALLRCDIDPCGGRYNNFISRSWYKHLIR